MHEPNKPGRPPLEPRIAALERRVQDAATVTDSERLAALEARIETLERRMAEMNLAFSRGYLPANV